MLLIEKQLSWKTVVDEKMLVMNDCGCWWVKKKEKKVGIIPALYSRGEGHSAGRSYVLMAEGKKLRIFLSFGKKSQHFDSDVGNINLGVKSRMYLLWVQHRHHRKYTTPISLDLVDRLRVSSTPLHRRCKLDTESKSYNCLDASSLSPLNRYSSRWKCDKIYS